ncbi:MAG: HNH endonuclease [Oligoflexia bacterium]|nr:HNH endonuclease [Oligoflexia bacterium]
MKDQDLLNQIKLAVQNEREATTKVLNLLMQIEKRKLFALRGYDSLFSFVVGYLGYSEPAAHRRIAAMRALKEFPKLEAKITSGSLSLTNLAQVQVAIRQEAKATGVKVASALKLELFEAVENKSTRECEKILRTQMPEAVPNEKRRELTESLTELKFVLDEATIKNLQKLKELWSHKNPGMSDAELVKAMAEFCLAKVDPEKKTKEKLELSKVENRQEISEASKTAPKTTAPEVTPTAHVNLTAKHKANPAVSRHIPVQTRKYVWHRDKGACQYQDPITKKLCLSKRYIEIDHVQPWALGGSHDPTNLRLLCNTHNMLMAEKAFGK